MDGAHAASCEEMSTALSKAETAAYKGLQQCIETVMAEVSCFLWKHILEDQWGTGLRIIKLFFLLKTPTWPFPRLKDCFQLSRWLPIIDHLMMDLLLITAQQMPA